MSAEIRAGPHWDKIESMAAGCVLGGAHVTRERKLGRCPSGYGMGGLRGRSLDDLQQLWAGG